jgi:predicted permease
MWTPWQDLRYGLRVLLRNPGFLLVAVLTLALGIAANTTVFSWIHAVLLRPFPGASDPDRLVAFESLEPNLEGHNISYADYRDYRDNLKLLSGLAVSLLPNLLRVGEGEAAQPVWAELVSGNYFEVLGVKPALGRFFSPDEYGDQPGAYPVAVISHRLWRTLFQSDPGVTGRTIRINRQELTIIGVAPPEFSGSIRGLAFDIWAPLMMGQQLNTVGGGMLENRRSRPLHGLGRLKPGVTIDQARAEVLAVAAELAQAYPDTNRGISATVSRVLDAHAGVQSLLRAPLQILMAMCLVVLLIACVNVSNLVLARSTGRQREFAVRLALGAGRGRLSGQLLTEALLLAGLGTLAALPLAMWMQQSLLYFKPTIGLPTGLDIEMNSAVFGFTALVCLGAALVSGALPALHSTRPDLNETLKEGGRSATSGAASQRLRSLFVVSEIALAFVALVAAGLFVSSFRAAHAIDIGLDARNVLVSRFYLSTSGYNAEQRQQFCLRLRERLEAAPGISAVSYSDVIPLGFGLGPGQTVRIEGYLPDPVESMTIGRTLVAPGFLSVLRLRLLDGRDFTALDDQQSAPVLIVNESFARRFFAGGPAVGRKVHAWGKWFTVVGVVKDSKYYYLTEPPRPYFYAPFRQIAGSADIAFYARTTGNPEDAIATLRREVAAIDPEAGGFEALPLVDYIDAPLFGQKIAAGLLSGLGALCLLLAAVGLYSVMAYGVSQRTHEIGIRMAIGAQSRDVLGMMVRQGLVLTSAGLLAGIAVSLAGAQLIAGMLLNVSASDPWVFAGAALFLGMVALLASYLPARRASRLNPVGALRQS